MQPSPQDHDDRPGTPPRPPYSPVTPVFSHAVLPNKGTQETPSHLFPPASPPSPTTQIPPSQTQTNFPATAAPPNPPPTFEPEPPAVPISESQNPDAIALRSAISILQIQKHQSLHDIQTLEKMKSAAAADPEGFARELAAGNIGADENGDFVNLARNGESAEKSGSNGKSSGFGRVPAPQNVVRMPPINWSKYQIVGEPLDKIHEEERRRPSSGEPRREDSTHRPPEHVLASPYRPLVDRLDTPAKRDDSTSSRGKKT